VTVHHADNGIGVAAALALLDSAADAKLPPLECLFTVDEETGLTGAFGLDASLLSGKLC
jgi:dipeptidase D